MSGVHNGGGRGTTRRKKARRRWLLDTYGDGKTVECAMKTSPKCEGTLTIETLTVDRYPIPGWRHGTYARDNIRPACAACNNSDPQRAWMRW